MLTVIDPDGSPSVVYNRDGTTISSYIASVSTDPPTPIVRHSSVTVAHVTASANTDHMIMPADAEIGDVVEIYVSSGGLGAIHVQPDSGSQLNDSGTDVAINIFTARIRKVTSTNWYFT